jgi:hypothetical protein
VIGLVFGRPCFVQGMFEDRGSQTLVRRIMPLLHCMARAWQEHGMMLAIYGMMMPLLRCRAISWQDHGNVTWQGHGNMKRTCKNETQG